MPIVANRDCKVMTFFKYTKQQSGFLLFETLEANFKCPDLSFLEQAESINWERYNLYIRLIFHKVWRYCSLDFNIWKILSPK